MLIIALLAPVVNGEIANGGGSKEIVRGVAARMRLWSSNPCSSSPNITLGAESAAPSVAAASDVQDLLAADLRMKTSRVGQLHS
jgi:hypothetical protein